MEKIYIYKIHYERSTPFSKGFYSSLIYRDTPIITTEDKESVKNLIRKYHIFSRFSFMYYQLISAPCNAENIPYSVKAQLPF